MNPTRRSVLTALFAVPVLGAAACSTGATGGGGGTSPGTGNGSEAPGSEAAGSEAPGSEIGGAASGAFPATIEHAFGETVIEAAPQRVATVSWSNGEIALALGVVPVGMPRVDFGGTEQGSTPWIDAALEELGAPLGSENAPTLYSETDGIAFDDIAALAPDVILAAYSGITAEDYERLTGIAPTVAYPSVPFGTDWQEATRMIGTALGLPEDAETVVRETESLLAEQAQIHPELQGTTFIYGNIDPAATPPINIYTPQDNRPKFLSALGMVLAPSIEDEVSGTDAFYIDWSAENANQLDSDVFVTWVADEAVIETITADPLLSQIPAVAAGRLVAHTDPTTTLAISASNPLSLAWAVDEVVPEIAQAAASA